jgi:hypothetical protein
MRWARHVARIGERIGVYRVLVGNLRERNHLEYLGVDGRIILNESSRSRVRAFTGLFWLRIGTSGGLLGTR